MAGYPRFREYLILLMKILAIETSCDETAAAIIEDGHKVISSVIASQADIHAITGGVVPEVAAREHSINLPYIYKQAIEESGLNISEIDAFAVTTTPGLIGSLLVGISAAKTLSEIYRKPLIETNHIEGHIYSTFLERKPEEICFPLLTLTVSGGHTQLYIIKGHKEKVLLGQTLDDAAGEAYDKIAKMLGLPYPGGPELAKAALDGDPQKFDLPVARLDNQFDFSFSGLKTAVLYLIRDLTSSDRDLTPEERADIAASAQRVINKALIKNILLATQKYEVKQVHVVGGVSANKELKSNLADALSKKDIPLLTPIKGIYSTDNAAMIGSAAYFAFTKV